MDSITCPGCGATSHHPDDIRERYCGRCHQWSPSRIPVFQVKSPEEFWILVSALADYERTMAESWPEAGLPSRAERVDQVRSIRERLLAWQQ